MARGIGSCLRGEAVNVYQACIRGLGQHAHIVSLLSFPADVWGSIHDFWIRCRPISEILEKPGIGRVG